ncbi:MAG: hypothetical protein ACYTJ0_17495 [Planctomycetota bacterium]
MKNKMLMSCAAAAVLGLVSPGFGQGTVVPIELTENTMSFDLEDDSSNVVLEIDLGQGENVTFTGIGWDMTLETIGASWASEASVAIGDTAGNVAVYLSPAAEIEEPLFDAATFISGDVFKLADVGIEDMVLPDGILRLQFFESYDDIPDEADAQWLNGSTISIEVIVPPDPCPADINGDGGVDVDDLIAVISAWGTCP